MLLRSRRPLVLFLFTIAGPIACATVEPGTPAVAVDSAGHAEQRPATAAGLRVSSRQLKTLASGSFGVVEVTFVNPSSRWVHVNRVDLDFGSPARNQRVQLPWGEELQSWQKATLQRNAIAYANQRTALETIAVLGAVTAGLGRSSGAGLAGGLLEVGATGTLMAQEIADRSFAAQTVTPFPEDHLLSLPFSVPPGLFAKKWILVNTLPDAPGGHDCIESVVMRLETSEGNRGEVSLGFGDHESDWQSSACNYDPAREQQNEQQKARANAALAARRSRSPQ